MVRFRMRLTTLIGEISQKKMEEWLRLTQTEDE
jgi:hypothetical protein